MPPARVKQLASANVKDGSLFAPDWKRRFRRRLLSWFSDHARDLPWRRTRDPYHVWISEIMLQQTQVATVVPYFERFIQAFPTVSALAAAPEDDVLRLWEGLGYYRRARQLHKAAAVIVAEHDGVFPRAVEQVLALPGIGRYTAGAITSIAYDDAQPIVEANTVRVLSRLLAYPGDTHSTSGQQLLWSAATELLPRRGAGAFNQAMMELGSEICAPRDPQCMVCPAALLCPTRAAGLTGQIPRPKPRPVIEAVRHAAVIVTDGPRVLTRRCPPQERWAGLWDFVRFDLPHDVQGEELQQLLHSEVARMTDLRIGDATPLVTIKHGVTRFRITLESFLAPLACPATLPAAGEFRWVARDELSQLPLNVTGRKVSQTLIENPARSANHHGSRGRKTTATRR